MSRPAVIGSQRSVVLQLEDRDGEELTRRRPVPRERGFVLSERGVRHRGAETICDPADIVEFGDEAIGAERGEVVVTEESSKELVGGGAGGGSASEELPSIWRGLMPASWAMSNASPIASTCVRHQR